MELSPPQYQSECKLHSEENISPKPQALAKQVVATIVVSARGQHVGKSLEWVEASREFKKLSPHPKPDSKYHLLEVRGDGTLEELEGARKLLVKTPTTALISGFIRDDVRESLRSDEDGAFWRSESAHPRSYETFADGLSRYFRSDIDGLDARKIDPDFDAREGIQAAHSVVRNFLDWIGAGFMIGDEILSASSRHGLTNPYELRLHWERQLDEPRTLAQQRRLVRWLNDRSAAKGLGRPFDENVYDAPHFLFTAPPRIMRRTFIAGRTSFVELTPDELRQIGFDVSAPRVSLHRISEPLLKLPDEIAADLNNARPPRTHYQRVKSTEGRKPAGKSGEIISLFGGNNDNRAHGHERIVELIAQIDEGGGKTHEPTRNIIASISAQRRDRWPVLCARYLPLVIEQIRKTSTNELRLQERLQEHADFEAWLEGCEKARRRFDSDDGIVYGVSAPEKPRVHDDVATAREKLAAAMQRVVGEAFAHDATERSKYTIFNAPPGLGKTEASIIAMNCRLRGDQVVLHLSPTQALSDETSKKRKDRIAGELRARGAINEDEIETNIAERVRVLKGREKLCIDKEGFGKYAKELEQHGISPSSVCKLCTKRDACPYINQAKSIAPDTYGVHPHLLTSTIARIPEDVKIGVVILDENILPLLTDKPQFGTSKSLGELKHEAEKATASRRVKSKGKREKKKRLFAPADLAEPLATVCNILDDADGRILAAALEPLKQTCQVINDDGTTGAKRIIDVAISGARDWHYDQLDAIRQIVEGQAKAKAASKKDGDEDEAKEAQPSDATAKGKCAKFSAMLRVGNELKAAKASAECAAFFGVILKAFRATIDHRARAGETDHVVGCWMYEKNGEKFVHAQVRNDIPYRLKDTPIIALDGTANPAVLAPILRRSGHGVEVIETPAAVPEGSCHLTQYVDNRYGWTSFIDYVKARSKKDADNDAGDDADCDKGAKSGKGDDSARRKFIELLKSIVVEAEREWTETGGVSSCVIDGKPIHVLVACQLEVAEALRKLDGEWKLPANVHVIHFNAERGVNAYEGVRVGFVIGRPMPHAREIEAKAEALHYDDPAVLTIKALPGDAPWLPDATRKLQMADGSWVEIPVESHPDPHVAQLVRSYVDDEARQAAHRLRIYNCTAANRVRIFVYGQCDVGVPIHEIGRFADSKRDVADYMLARGFVILDRPYIEKAHRNWLTHSNKGDREYADAMAHLGGWTNSGGSRRSLSVVPISNIPIRTADSEGCSIEFVHLTVKLPGCRYACKVLIDPRRHPDPLKAARDTFGADVEVREVTRPQLALPAPTAADLPRPALPAPAAQPEFVTPAPPRAAPVVLAGVAALTLAACSPVLPDQSTAQPVQLSVQVAQVTQPEVQVVARKRGRPKMAVVSKASERKRRQRERARLARVVNVECTSTKGD